jgi:UDP:flavonoid glycosyltransferase YjiC (YdhE family)
VPYVNIANAYWSPYARPRFVAPDIPLTRTVGPQLATLMFKAAMPWALAAHAAPLNAVRRRYTLPPLPADVRYAYTDADLTLFADLPNLIPLTDPPASHRHLGPIEWSPKAADPPWWRELPEGRGAIYVNLGSSGSRAVLPEVLDAAASLSIPVIAAAVPSAPARSEMECAWMVESIDGSRASRRALAVVCNGGSPASQQALLNGAPVLGLPSNLDQFLNMGYVARAGYGLLERADRASAPSIRKALTRLLQDANFRTRAEQVERTVRVAETHAQFRDALGALA